MAIDNSFKTSANRFSLDSPLLTGKHENGARADNEKTVCAMKLSETAQSGVATGQNSDRLGKACTSDRQRPRSAINVRRLLVSTG